MAKNIGVVKRFGINDNNYGLIKFLRGDDDLSPDDKIYFRKSDFVSTAPRLNDFVSFNLKSHWQELNINCWRVGKVIVLNWNDLPTEMILTYWDELNVDNKRAAFVKYFDALPADKLADMAKNLPPAEILQAVKDKATFREKFSELVKICAAQAYDFNAWAKIILDNDFPSEMILSRWDKLNVDNKRAAFVKYFDALPADKLADMAKDLPPAEFVDSVIDKRTFTQKISAIIERSNQKFYWALYLLGNVTLFRKIKVGEDVMIFFMYEWVKREKPLNKLVDLLQEKRDAINASLYAKIVCLYICAAHERNIGSGRHNELMNRAQKAVAEIFNRRVDVLKSQSQNPAEIVHFDYPEAHILPPCENPRKICSFCEAIVWLKKIPDEDGKYHWENHSWCRRSERADLPCSRLCPDVELSAKNWSLIELTEKLDLRTYDKYPKDYKLNREIFTRFGGEVNRLNELLERIKCRECGRYMRADLNAAKWLVVENIRNITNVEHFPVLIATFSCQTHGCDEEGKPVYISYCWHCGETIDSRDSKVKIAGKGSGYYLCNKCGAGYKDYADPHGDNATKIKYAIFPGMICPSCTKCPKCGGQEFRVIPAGEKFKLKCTRCGHETNISSTIKDITHGGNVYKKGICTACEHELEWNKKRLDDFSAKQNFSPIT